MRAEVVSRAHAVYRMPSRRRSSASSRIGLHLMSEGCDPICNEDTRHALQSYGFLRAYASSEKPARREAQERYRHVTQIDGRKRGQPSLRALTAGGSSETVGWRRLPTTNAHTPGRPWKRFQNAGTRPRRWDGCTSGRGSGRFV
jgi:hypothetical protein